ncbi:MAG: NAD(P)/FAD-dependent oxidoreductase [Anaerorhabdus sp.]
MIEVKNIELSLDQTMSEKIIAKKLGCSVLDIQSFSLLKESLDARKNKMHLIYTVLVKIKNEKKYYSLLDVQQHTPINDEPLELENHLAYQPIVIGFGPSGMFAALTLAEAGCRPIILERGACVEQRTLDVQQFWDSGFLNPESNVQFGEGGAGTFSDGKLTTRIKDHRVSTVLKRLVDAGADPAILYQSHPHLGTDKLVDIVKNIRNRIISLGGEIHFDTKFESFTSVDDKKIVHTSQGDFSTNALFLCLGHSAKDTITSLMDCHLHIEPKSFAVGLRIEHSQKFINVNQYGKYASHPRLGAAEYRLSHTASNNRGVYSFCMCPGGVVIPSSNVENTIVVNGMSKSDRADTNANSALLVQIPVEDFYVSSALDGFIFQEKIEQQAFQLAGETYKAPVQLVQDYINNTPTTSIGSIIPSYSLGYTLSNLRSLFSAEVNQSLTEALLAFDKKIKGFSSSDAIFTGPETRSSCPIRISRNEFLESVSHPLVFPVGEGSGYAGGIISSAVDGIRCAQQFITSQNKK